MILGSLFKTLGPIVAGAAAGVAVVVLAGSRGPSAPAAATATAETRAPLPRVTLSPESLLLSQRVASLESRIAEIASASPAAPSAAPSPTHLLDEREERGQRVLGEHVKLLAQHSAERRDSAWAARKEEDVGAKLGALSETMSRAFAVQAVECRSSTCVAKLVWPSEGAARASLRSLLQGSADVGCAREIAFPPADDERSYTASFYLDCAPVAPPG